MGVISYIDPARTRAQGFIQEEFKVFEIYFNIHGSKRHWPKEFSKHAEVWGRNGRSGMEVSLTQKGLLTKSLASSCQNLFKSNTR